MAGCSAHSELFFRLLLKNTVRWAHITAYPIFWIAPCGAHKHQNLNPNFLTHRTRPSKLKLFRCGMHQTGIHCIEFGIQWFEACSAHGLVRKSVLASGSMFSLTLAFTLRPYVLVLGACTCAMAVLCLP